MGEEWRLSSQPAPCNLNNAETDKSKYENVVSTNKQT